MREAPKRKKYAERSTSKMKPTIAESVPWSLPHNATFPIYHVKILFAISHRVVVKIAEIKAAEVLTETGGMNLYRIKKKEKERRIGRIEETKKFMVRETVVEFIYCVITGFLEIYP